MPGFDGTGPNGMGPMTGGGRGYCGSTGRGVAWRPFRTRYSTPYGFPRYGAYGPQPFVPPMSRKQELDFLKSQTEALKDELGEIEAEIGKLSAEKDKEKK